MIKFLFEGISFSTNAVIFALLFKYFSCSRSMMTHWQNYFVDFLIISFYFLYRKIKDDILKNSFKHSEGGAFVIKGSTVFSQETPSPS